ncbi:DUF4115 domain-containing protein [Virgibacillus sp. 179-BFC.A HS]|uniref:DUF4115 domain-containing protein n=1 Tax=Tigheibacillus jepli TaxID=3035914 RepID=A0ABU5CHK1_9BACI|nr:RodZ domain-containing protein [Virgibacillus sp. 179-BFC.A HS]MDY0405816.1 DUF4115 domain-containing protein [Virgibacillus sp. 179-BFC.A HS]
MVFLPKNISSSKGDTESPKEDNEIIINGPNDDEQQQAKDYDEDEQSENKDSNKSGDADTDKEENQSELKLVETGSGSRPESVFDLENPDDKLTVKLESTDNTWLQVSNGEGENKYYDSLTSDKSPVELDMSGDDEIYFNIGNASALTITINGQELEYPLDPKQNVVQKIRVHVKK